MTDLVFDFETAPLQAPRRTERAVVRVAYDNVPVQELQGRVRVMTGVLNQLKSAQMLASTTNRTVTSMIEYPIKQCGLDISLMEESIGRRTKA